MEEIRHTNKILVGNTEGNKTLGTLRRKGGNNVGMNLKETGCKDVDWIHLAQKRTSDELSEQDSERSG
jgi:hypothetical protein